MTEKGGKSPARRLDEAVFSAPFDSGMGGGPAVRETTPQKEAEGVKTIAEILADLPADAHVS